MPIRRSENLVIGEEGSKKLYYAAIFRPNEPNPNGCVYSLEVAEAALSKFIQDNPDYKIEEKGQTATVLDSYEISEDKLILKSLVREDTACGKLLSNIVNNTNIRMTWQPKVEYTENTEDKTVSEIKILSIKVGAGKRY